MNFKSIPVLFFLFFASNFLQAQKSYNALVYEGNKKFDSKDYAASSGKYLEAIAEKSSNYTAHYNLGNSLYKEKKYEEAKAEYQKAEKFTKSKYEKAAALYNQGNVEIQGNKPDKAAKLYKQALKQDPYNEAIRKNYEIAMLKDKEKKDQQKNGKGKGGGKDQKGKDDSDKGDQKKNQKNGKGDNQKGNDQGKPNQPQKQENKIPQEAENQILKDIENREKETARRILNKKSSTMPQSNEKDW